MKTQMTYLEKRKAVWGYIFVAPAILLILLVAIYPLFQTVKLSFYEYSLLAPQDQQFIGMENYKKLIHDARFWNSLANTMIFTVVSVFFELVLGLLLALVMNLPLRMIGIVRAAALVPWAIPTVVSATMWLWLYNDQWGFVNILLGKLGLIDQYHAWLSEPASALAAVIVSDVWKTTPFMALLILAGLQMIPKDMYESASVDGATRLRQFFSITLPMIKSTILVAVLFRTLDSFRVFDLVYVMTMGGPGNATEVTSLYAYKTLFKDLDFGYGSTLAVSILVVIAAISAIYIWTLSEKEERA
ncbi:carbohydrate ABC transporter permease [Paenibacillus naphthalenovorans]|uniref:carbohydrate ABC transporter permease n=1 Tax=Paenibacillus naphthalenovorans TaxID=162209 RepID=UPI00088BDB0F|nr:sugar ABC transporter permease [Paenibacillus naphthalenovorans]GCL74619.1 sugar ABC transporter permease [Paenibacillus naphthalenovorans]SDJ67588.1 multiple sugar transport system permease protein [Paenibacillus naphthalenovorans]